MGIRILYFSRTNFTEDIALELGESINAKIYDIKDNKSWIGFSGFIRGCLYSMFNMKVDIDYNDEVLQCKKIILMSPVWRNDITPAVKEFIRENKDVQYSLILTNAFSNQKALKKRINRMYNKFQNVWIITKKLNNRSEIIKEIECNYSKIKEIE